MAHHPAARSWTERVEGPGDQPAEDLERHARSQGHTNPAALGIAGHMVHMGAMLFPVLAAELITDAQKYRKAVRIGSVLTTVAYEALYTIREAERRQRWQQRAEECEHPTRA